MGAGTSQAHRALFPQPNGQPLCLVCLVLSTVGAATLGLAGARAQEPVPTCAVIVDHMAALQLRIEGVEATLGELERTLSAELARTERQIAGARSPYERAQAERTADELATRLGEIEALRDDLERQSAATRELAEQMGCGRDGTAVESDG